MTERKADKGLHFEALRLGIERCDLELVLGFYAEDAQLSIVNADAPQGSPFELHGKAEIAKYLRAVFGQEASHRVEREVVVAERVTFREACESKRRWRCATARSFARRTWWPRLRGRIVKKRSAKDHLPDKPTRRRTLLRQTVSYAPSRQPKRRVSDDVQCIERGEKTPDHHVLRTGLCDLVGFLADREREVLAVRAADRSPHRDPHHPGPFGAA